MYNIATSVSRSCSAAVTETIHFAWSWNVGESDILCGQDNLSELYTGPIAENIDVLLSCNRWPQRYFDSSFINAEYKNTF